MNPTKLTHKPYESPTVLLVPFATQDIITASGGELGEWDTEL